MNSESDGEVRPIEALQAMARGAPQPVDLATLHRMADALALRHEPRLADLLRGCGAEINWLRGERVRDNRDVLQAQRERDEALEALARATSPDT